MGDSTTDYTLFSLLAYTSLKPASLYRSTSPAFTPEKWGTVTYFVYGKISKAEVDLLGAVAKSVECGPLVREIGSLVPG